MKICLVSTDRSEFNLNINLILSIGKFKQYKIDFIVIYKNKVKPNLHGFVRNKLNKIFFIEEIDTKSILLSSKTTKKLENIYQNNKYSSVLMIGDRHEMLNVAMIATIYNCHITHFHGGEITEGSYDNLFRNALSKLSSLHFVSHDNFKKNLIDIGEKKSLIANIGAVYLLNKNDYLSKKEVMKKLNLNLKDTYYLITYHPETKNYNSKNDILNFKFIINFLINYTNEFLVVTQPGRDIGSNLLIKIIIYYSKKFDGRIKFIQNFGNIYPSIVKYSSGVVGNSSSGIIETPSLGIPTFNFGNRQYGRVFSKSIINVKFTKNSFQKAIKKSKSLSFNNILSRKNNVYYKRNSLKLIHKHLQKIVKQK